MLFIFLLFLAVFLHSIWKAYQDFAFYRNNDWDYSVDSGVEIYHGDSTDKEARMGNRLLAYLWPCIHTDCERYFGFAGLAFNGISTSYGAIIQKD